MAKEQRQANRSRRRPSRRAATRSQRRQESRAQEARCAKPRRLRPCEQPNARPKSGRAAKARLREHYAKSVVPALNKDFGYKNPMAVPKIEKVSINIGLGEATGNSKLMDGAVNELTLDRRTEAGGHQGEEIDRRFQAARRYVDRLHGDAARRPHVRVSRSPDERGAAACARLPRRFAEIVRWPRELYARVEGSVDLPRDRLQQGGKDEGHEHFASPPPRRRMPKAWRCCGTWACRSGSKEEDL